MIRVEQTIQFDAWREGVASRALVEPSEHEPLSVQVKVGSVSGHKESINVFIDWTEAEALRHALNKWAERRDATENEETTTDA